MGTRSYKVFGGGAIVAIHPKCQYIVWSGQKDGNTVVGMSWRGVGSLIELVSSH